MAANSEKHSIAMMNHRQKRQEQAQLAIDNAAARAKRSPQDQIALLDKRLGKGVGATKERNRLATKLA